MSLQKIGDTLDHNIGSPTMKLGGIIGLTSGAIGTLFGRGPWTSLGWNTGLGTFILGGISKLAGKGAKLIDKISNKIANVFS